MSTFVEVDDNLSLWQFFLYYMSGAGGIFGVISISIMLAHIIIYFCKQQKKIKEKIKKYGKKTKEQISTSHDHINKIVYYLAIGYLISGILICLTYSIIRSNIITRINTFNFTQSNVHLVIILP